MAYKVIHEQFWTDPKIRNLKMEDKFLFLYLITNPHSHSTGIYYLPKKIITLDTGIDRGIDRGIKELSDRGLISYDKDIKIVFVKNMLKYQNSNQNYNENQKKGIAKHLSKLHNSILIKEFLDFYKDLNIIYIDRGIDRGMDTPSYSDSDSDSDLDKDKEGMQGEKKEEWKDTLWLKEFLEKQNYISKEYIGHLSDYDWWDKVSIIVNGLNIGFIEKEFAKMGTWIMDNSHRKPTLRGIRRFVQGWLERAYERERVNYK